MILSIQKKQSRQAKTFTWQWLPFLCFLALFLFSGCSGKVADPTIPAEYEQGSLPPQIISESKQLQEEQQMLQSSIQVQNTKVPDVEPVMPTYNPLAEHLVSFSLIDENIQLVLFSLAKSAGMNLILSPDLELDNKRITLKFDQVPASTVLDELLKSFDVYYEVKQNVIHVKSLQERTYSLNFLNTSVSTSFQVGGDVLGGDDVNVGGLTGAFSISGKGGDQSNPYDALEASLTKFLSPNGKYALNRLAGTLYVKDSPKSIIAISGMILRLQKMLSRQLLIEAQIIEVGLSDKYEFGINWKHLRDSLATSSSLESFAWGAEAGLVINNGPSGSTNNFSAIINALKTYGSSKIVSNPTIRVKHAQPAMLSVGTSFTYLEKVTTTTSTGDNTEDTTEPETATVFDGLILGVIPFIEDDNNITLQINPIKSDVDAESLVPVSFAGGNSIALPIVNIKELSTTIGLQNNDIVVLGGLIDHQRNTAKSGIPGLSKIPFLGQLVRKDFNTQVSNELVIILKVSLI